MSINTANEYLIGSNGRTVQPMMPPVFDTRQKAYRFAAWLSELAIVLPNEEGEPETFEEVLEAVRNGFQ